MLRAIGRFCASDRPVVQLFPRGNWISLRVSVKRRFSILNHSSLIILMRDRGAFAAVFFG